MHILEEDVSHVTHNWYDFLRVAAYSVLDGAGDFGRRDLASGLAAKHFECILARNAPRVVEPKRRFLGRLKLACTAQAEVEPRNAPVGFRRGGMWRKRPLQL